MNAPPMLCPVGPELLFIEHKITTAEKLGCVQDILLSVAALEEQSGAVLTEAWKLLTEGKLWRASYFSLDVAVQEFDSSQLKKLRNLFSSELQRKQKSIKLNSEEVNSSHR